MDSVPTSRTKKKKKLPSKAVIREEECLRVKRQPAGMYGGESGQWAAIFTALTNS